MRAAEEQRQLQQKELRAARAALDEAKTTYLRLRNEPPTPNQEGMRERNRTARMLQSDMRLLETRVWQLELELNLRRPGGEHEPEPSSSEDDDCGDTAPAPFRSRFVDDVARVRRSCADDEDD